MAWGVHACLCSVKRVAKAEVRPLLKSLALLGGILLFLRSNALSNALSDDEPAGKDCCPYTTTSCLSAKFREQPVLQNIQDVANRACTRVYLNKNNGNGTQRSSRIPSLENRAKPTTRSPGFGMSTTVKVFPRSIFFMRSIARSICSWEALGAGPSSLA